MGWAGHNLANIIADAMMEGKKQLLMPDGSIIDLPPVQKTWRKFRRESYCNRKAIEIVDKLLAKKNNNENS